MFGIVMMIMEQICWNGEPGWTGMLVSWYEVKTGHSQWWPPSCDSNNQSGSLTTALHINQHPAPPPSPGARPSPPEQHCTSVTVWQCDSVTVWQCTSVTVWQSWTWLPHITVSSRTCVPVHLTDCLLDPKIKWKMYLADLIQLVYVALLMSHLTRSESQQTTGRIEVNFTLFKLLQVWSTRYVSRYHLFINKYVLAVRVDGWES